VNQSPGGAAKLGIIDEAFMAIWTNTSQNNGVLLRTSPPLNLPAVQQMTYSGAFPVSKWEITDSRIPVEADLYAFPEIHIGDVEKSATPTVIFALNVKNPTSGNVLIIFR
jgi:non-lysosomal glucosylceramidase